MKKIQLAIMAVAVGLAMQSQASLYDITFSGGGTSASGQIDVVGGFATSGSFVITSAANGFTPVSYALAPNSTLAPNPNVAGTFYSPSTFFTVDNVVTASGNPFLDINGLLFISSGGIEVNLWGNGPSDYTLYDNTGAQAHVNGTATLTAVPEASTVIAGALLLLPFGASTLRILRRKQTV
jgi:hypothetical protein